MGDLRRQTVTAAAPMVIGSGLFFKLISTTAPVSVTFHRGGFTKKTTNVEAGYQYGPVPENLRFDKCVITSATTQLVSMLVGDEFEDYSRVIGTVQIQQATAIVSLPDAAVGTTAVVVVPANASRRRAVVRAGDANTDAIRVGDASVSLTQGIKLQGGQAFTTDAGGDVYAIAMSGTQTVELIEETG